jgi:succinate dehydrogenase / fumarate reductase flavoprotein subunit
VARAVAQAALRRTESRGAHQREDFPALSPEWNVNQLVHLHGNEVTITNSRPIASEVAQ